MTKARSRTKDASRPRLRIIQLCTRFPPASGGVETHVHAISKELRSRGHEVEVYTSDLLTETPLKRLDPGDERYSSVDGIPVRRFKARSLPGEAQYSVMPAMVRAVMSARADIIHAHSYGFFQTHVAMAARKMGHSRFVITPHFHPEWASGKPKGRRFLRRVYDKVVGGSTLTSADAILYHSKWEAETLKELGFNDAKLRLVQAGIPEHLVDMTPDPVLFEKKFGPGHPFVLFTGRLAENKGLDVLVDAAALVLKKLPRTRFVVVGEDGGMRRKLLSRAEELGVLDAFVLTGFIGDEAVYRSAFAACDAFVLPSTFEAFGLVVLEAMALGTPCVATNVGIVPEVIDDGRTGLLVEPGDHKALAKALSLMLGDKARAHQMGSAAKKAVGRNFTWPRIVDRIEEVYNEVLFGQATDGK